MKIKIHISKCVHSTDFQFVPLQRKLSNCFLLPTLKDFNVGIPGVVTNIQMTFYLCWHVLKLVVGYCNPIITYTGFILLIIFDLAGEVLHITLWGGGEPMGLSLVTYEAGNWCSSAHPSARHHVVNLWQWKSTTVNAQYDVQKTKHQIKSSWRTCTATEAY
jgi:hypothetical protein